MRQRQLVQCGRRGHGVASGEPAMTVVRAQRRGHDGTLCANKEQRRSTSQ
jgi:hypothetical protein